MQVRMLVPMAGNVTVWEIGQIAEFGDAEAERFIEAGFAEAVEEEEPKTRSRAKKTEKAVEPAPETPES